MSSCLQCNGVEFARLEAMRIDMQRPTRFPGIGGPVDGWKGMYINVDVRWCLGCGRLEMYLADPRAWASAVGAKLEGEIASGYR